MTVGIYGRVSTKERPPHKPILAERLLELYEASAVVAEVVAGARTHRYR